MHTSVRRTSPDGRRCDPSSEPEAAPPSPVTERKGAPEARRRAAGSARKEPHRSDIGDDDVRGLPFERSARAAAEAAQERIAGILDSIADPFIALDHEARLRYVNLKAEELFGCPRETLISRHLWEVFPIRDGSTFREHIAAAMTGTRPVQFEELAPHLDAWFEVHAFPFKDGLSIHFRDVTERKKAQRELDARAVELARSNAELEQFAYVASHDLQEPLRVVSSFTQLLARRYQGKLDRDADEFIAFTVDAAARMQKMINDLLVYSRVGRKGGEPTRVRLETVLEQALANLRSAIEESGARVSHGPLPELLGDQGQLLQLLQNLIGNAIKFRRDEPRIHVSASELEDAWEITVEDNGIGIEPEYFDRIFVIFQRLHGKDEYPGTGIGLSLCKRIVERHGGTIRIESMPGEGSRFIFTLPKLEQDAGGG